MVPQNVWDLLRNLSLAGLFLFFSILIGKLVSRFLGSFLKTEIKNFLEKIGYGEIMADFFINGLKYFIYFVGVLLALSQFGFSPYLLQLLVLFTSIAIIVTFLYSLHKLLINISAGIYLYRIKEIKEGSRVKINSREGEVLKKKLLSTTIETDKEKIIIPNSLLIDKEIKKVN